jgi:hypothetical protein
MSVCLSLCLSVCLFVYRRVDRRTVILSIHPSICLCVCLPFCPSVRFSTIIVSILPLKSASQPHQPHHFPTSQIRCMLPALWEINSVSDGDVRSFIHYRKFVFHVFRSLAPGLTSIDIYANFQASTSNFSPLKHLQVPEQPLKSNIVKTKVLRRRG